MANPLKRLGKAKIKVGDSLVDSMPGATLIPGGAGRTTVLGANAVLGFTETPAASHVEFSVAIKRGFDPMSLHVDNASIVFEGDTGQIHTISNAWSLNPPTIDSGAGTAAYVFEGPAATQVIG
ncbi:phage tail tube protein [Stenotrophomonas sp. MMGLT7]|uniref:phage tail tube protein n=1 Tax=Stenotrophomonas sp. MMGLT7 TaxID=2901227 RepID=UPI001E63B9CD|nr:phage tail tube protein [Stenotrophomonas sp. MMGLT7]MCD7099120.1 phage tail tube protein [Stenotrophomonas sp. MMGLT7]